MSDSPEDLGQQLRRLDSDNQSTPMDASKLVHSVAKLRKRKRVIRSVATTAVVCGVVASFACVVWPVTFRNRVDQTATNVAPGDATRVESATEEVERLKRELEEFRQRSQQITQVLAKLDTVIQQQEEIDRRLEEVEWQAWEDSIRLKQSESLTIDVAYEFHY